LGGDIIKPLMYVITGGNKIMGKECFTCAHKSINATLKEENVNSKVEHLGETYEIV
jgi:hypothetical protein